MLKIGLTGGIASGKSTVCQLFAQYNVPIIDADIIARALAEPNQPAFSRIVALFGSAVLQDNGVLDRKRLRQLIFSAIPAKHQLEAILHPLVHKELSRQSDQQASSYCILVIPLLVETGMHDLVDRVLVINVDPKKQEQRLCRRDHIPQQDALAIIKQQASQIERIAIADDIIDNNATIAALAPLIDDLHQHYINLTKSCAAGGLQAPASA